MTAKRTVSLPEDQTAYIDGLVASGAFTSTSEVVRAGLCALREREAAVDRWLERDVVPVYDAMRDDPARAVSLDAAMTALRARHADRTVAERETQAGTTGDGAAKA